MLTNTQIDMLAAMATGAATIYNGRPNDVQRRLQRLGLILEDGSITPDGWAMYRILRRTDPARVRLPEELANKVKLVRAQYSERRQVLTEEKDKLESFIDATVRALSVSTYHHKVKSAEDREKYVAAFRAAATPETVEQVVSAYYRFHEIESMLRTLSLAEEQEINDIFEAAAKPREPVPA